jgi:hypothetical protein
VVKGENEKLKAEITDLRAQLASERQSKEYEQRHAVESETALAQAHAQLAAKGQGYAVEIKPGEKCPCGQTRDWCISNECKDAAPASAQPAVKDHVLREVVNSLRDTALVYHAHGSLRERLRQCLDPLLPASAQPADDDLEARNNVARALGLGVSHRASFAWSYLLGVIEDLVKFAEDAEEASAQPDRGAALTTEQIDDIIQAIKTSMNIGSGFFFPRGWNVLLDKLHAMRDAPSPASQPVEQAEPLYSPQMYRRIIEAIGPLPLKGPTVADFVRELVSFYHEAMAARRALGFLPDDAEVTPEEIERTIKSVSDDMVASRQKLAAVAPSDAKGKADAANAGGLRAFTPTEQQYAEWCERHDLPDHLSRDAFSDAASLYLTATSAADEQMQRMRAAFHVNMLRAFPDKTHAEIDAEINRACGIATPLATSAADAKDAALADVLNTTLWLYRRLPQAYGNPPFVDKAILTMAEYLGLDDVPAAIKGRAAMAAAPSSEKGGDK